MSDLPDASTGKLAYARLQPHLPTTRHVCPGTFPRLPRDLPTSAHNSLPRLPTTDLRRYLLGTGGLAKVFEDREVGRPTVAHRQGWRLGLGCGYREYPCR